MCHPLDGKPSLIYLKRHGELKLRFQQQDSSWHEVTAQLGPLVSTKEPFTHASFASNNDSSLLLAAYDVAQRLHMYRVETSWNVPTDKRSTTPFDKPGLHTTLISIEDDCRPVNQVSHDLTTGTESSGPIAAQLTHLNFLPITPDQEDGSLPTIQAVFCHPPNLVSVDQLSSQEANHSILVRWQVHQVQQAQLHSSLDQVTSKKKSVGSVTAKNTFMLRRLADITLHLMVLAAYPLWYNMLFAFAYSDGTIEIRKRSTMEAISPDSNTDTVTSLLQAGFTFPHAEPSLHVAFSQNYCMAACMQQDGSIKIRSMEYQHGSLATDDNDAHHSAALAALVLQSASAANQFSSSDDIFSIMGPLTEKRRTVLINLLFEGLQVNIDCGTDDQSIQHLQLLGRAPFFVKILSAMNLLGLRGPSDRSLSSKLAWIVLNVKYVTQILTTITRIHAQVEKNTQSSLRPDVVPPLIGICRWLMNFMAYLLDQLFTLGRAVHDIPSQNLTKEVLERKILAQNNPAVLLLLLAFPRAMMQQWTKPLTWIKRSVENFTSPSQPVQPPEVRKLFTPLQSALGEIPFEWRWFDFLVNDTHNHVRAAYKRANLTDVQRNHCERELMLGRIPELLFPIAKRLVTDTLWNEKVQSGCLADKLDSGRLMFFDTTWLGFQESKRSAQWHDTHVVDVCQKMVIRGNGRQEHPSATGPSLKRGRSDSIQSVDGAGEGKSRKLRRCVRCAAYMEDVVQGLPGYTPYHASWLMGVAKQCVCGNSWMMADEPGRVK